LERAGAPGKFQILVDGKPLPELFGVTNAEWFWQKGGEIKLAVKKANIALHDLTGLTEDATL
jgi:hypothetical protein